MALLKLKSASFLLIEDNRFTNIVPLLLELCEENTITKVFCYEQPIGNWKCVFQNHKNTIFNQEFEIESYDEYTNGRSSILIDSINQMILCLGWPTTLKYLLKLKQAQSIEKIIVILHKDCLLPTSKLQFNLEHIANGIISYDTIDQTKIFTMIKRNGKLHKSTETLSYDHRTNTLKSVPHKKEVKKEEEPQGLPANLSTFKIEMEPSEKAERKKLKLPYMSKIHEGESKVFYEPDAVDDWDEEDPDDDLDI